MRIDYVELTAKDLEHLITVCQWVIDYKHRVLSKKNYSRFESEYLPKLVDQLKENRFKVVDPMNNTFTWIIDQIAHSRRIIPGQAQDEWQPLSDMPQVKPLLISLRAAAQGHKAYRGLQNQEHISRLFD